MNGTTCVIGEAFDLDATRYPKDCIDSIEWTRRLFHLRRRDPNHPVGSRVARISAIPTLSHL